MARKMLVLLMLVVVSLLCVGCDDSDLNDVEDFLNDSEASKTVNEAVDNIQEEVEDYVTEMATDAVNMTEALAEENLPEASPEASQDIRELVIENLDNVGQAVLDADAAAKELQACFEACDGDYPDVAGSKVAANLVCVAECKGK